MLMPVSGVFAEVFDYSSGYTDNYTKGNEFDYNYSDYYPAYDNDISTSVHLGTLEYTLITFNEPTDIVNTYINFESGENIFLIFTDSSRHRTVQGVNQSGYYSTNYNDVKSIRIKSNSSIFLNEIEFFTSELNLDKIPPNEITNLSTIQTELKASFAYELPTDEDFSHVKIYQDDVLIADNVTDTSYTVDNLDYGGTYNFKFTTVDETGNESEGVVETVTIATTDLEEIKELNAEASHDRIDLSWALPETEYFEHVNIYRKSVSDVQTFSLLSTDEYDPLFETNGTYFNDLTVEEQTTYDYKLTTEFQGLESEGVTVQATTLAAPPPELGGQEFEEQENGDYLVTWQQPETGQVRILVDGQEYVVVPATDKQYTIPASDMKYSALGDPLVGLQTIGDNGEESEVEQQESNVNLPFGINELLITSAGLLRVIGSLILLGLSFILVPKFIKVIKQSLNNKKSAESERTEREQRVSERAYREPRESRISTREGRMSTRVPREYRKGE